MKIRFWNSFLILLGVISISARGFAQQEVSVNPAKGLLNVNIPLYSFNMADFKIDIGYNYVGRGMKPGNTSSSRDGWDFYGAGTVKRVLRGLPDEKAWSSGDNRYGWKGGAMYSFPPVLTIADDNDNNNCTDEQTNYNNIVNNYNGNTDYEPDLFVVDAPGLSFTMMFDNQGNLRALNAMDVKIEFVSNYYFVITTNKGIKYTFGYAASASKQVVTNTALDLFISQTNFYATQLTYPDLWYLTKIEANTSAGYVHLDYAYYTDVYRSINEDQNVLIKNYAVDTARSSKLYSLNYFSVNRRYLKSITSSLGSKIEMPLESDRPLTFNIFNSLTAGKPADRTISVAVDGDRSFVNNIYETLLNGSIKTLYNFFYYQPSSPTPDIYKPNKTDAWGYMNGSSGTSATPQLYVYPALKNTTGLYRPYPIPGYSGSSYILPGNDKAANDNYTAYGALKAIAFPNGGRTSFEYESNSFLDQDAGAEVKGGGIRIKAINYFDGLNLSTVVRKEYTYKNDLNQTSGVINLLPAYAISTPYYKDIISNVTKSYAQVVSDYGVNSMNYWNSLTARTDYDLYHGESQVSYSQVTITQPGNGKIKQVYSTPASFWDLTNKPLSYPAEPCNSGNGTFISKAYYQYPFSPLGNSSQCNLLKEYTYNESGNLLKKLEYDYENFNTSPVKIYGLAIDNNLGIKQISKYAIDVNNSILKQTKETVYDSNLSGNGLLTQTDYDNTAFARNIKAIQTTNSDNSQSITSFVYSGDFSTVNMADVSSNQDLQAIVLLNTQNNRNEVLEKTVSIRPKGLGGWLTFSSQANIFAKNTAPLAPLPILKEVRVLNKTSGLSDFSQMAATGTSPNRSLSVDSRYKSVKLFENYNKYNQAAKVTEQRNFSTMIPDTALNVPLLKLQGVERSNILFSNFDGIDTARSFKPSGGPAVYTTDSYFGRGVVLKDGRSLSNTFSRKAGDKFYKIAFLAKAPSSTSVSLTIYNGGASVYSGTITINASSEYQYYEKEINLSSWINGSFFIGSAAEVQMDNAILYPVNAQFSACNYSNAFTKTAEMGSTGVGQCYDYDVYGHLLASRDLKKNITSAQFYNPEGSGILTHALGFTYASGSNNVAGIKLKFKIAIGSYLPGTKYSWNFGDGTTLVSYDTVAYHAFAAAGNYSVKVSVSHPDYATHPEFTNLSYTAPSLTILPASTFYATLCASGVTSSNPCTSVYHYGNCPNHPPGNVDSPNGTIIYATAFGCGGKRYLWEISFDGVEYIPYPPQYESQTSITFSKYDGDYYIRCTVMMSSCETSRATNTIHIISNCSVL